MTREKCKSFTWCEDTTGAQVHGTARVRGHPCGASVHVYVGCSGLSAHGSGSVLAWRGRGTAAWRGLCGISLSGPPPPPHQTTHTHTQPADKQYIQTQALYHSGRSRVLETAAPDWSVVLTLTEASTSYISVIRTRDRDLDQGQVQVGQRGGVCVWMVWCRQSDPPPRAWTPPPRS